MSHHCERYIQRIAGGVVHDLNNTLTAFSGSLELLELSADDPSAVRETVAALQRSLSRTTTLAEALNVYASALASTTAAAARTPIVKLMDDLGAATAAVDGAPVQTEIAGNERSVVGKRPMIERAVIELLRNAREATDEAASASPPQVCIREVADAQRWIEVTATDFGPGIPTEVADTLFDPFVTTKPKHRGLGLSIARAIAESAGGSLAVAGDGATTVATLRLPVADSG